MNKDQVEGRVDQAKGKIKELGTHYELIALNGLYADLVSTVFHSPYPVLSLCLAIPHLGLPLLALPLLSVLALLCLLSTCLAFVLS